VSFEPKHKTFDLHEFIAAANEIQPNEMGSYVEKPVCGLEFVSFS